MGAGASVQASETSELSDAGKAALLSHLQSEYETQAASAGADEKIKTILDGLKETYDTKAKELQDTEKNNGATDGKVSGESNPEAEPEVEAEITASVATFAEKFGTGVDAKINTAKTSEFRKRRLSLSASSAAINTTENETASQNSVVMYRSEEIEAAPDAVPLPFSDAKVGTYSCHGVEPSYDEDAGVTAKINQDRGCVVYPFKEDKRQALFSVFDGHGEHGDAVSHFVMNELQSRLAAHPSLLEDPCKALKESYVQADQSLRKSKPNESNFSGTTAVSVLIRKESLWIANAGDSRAVLAKEKGETLKSVDLSIDQNPDSPAEKARIEAAGGFVSPPPEPGLSSRVWLDEAMTQIGLAMARSIGDYAAKGVGVIAEPEVTTHKITAADKFLVLASDGVWEFISSQEAVDVVNSSLGEGTMKATQALIEAAAAKWREVEGDYRDDITAVVVQLPCFPDDA